jgi:hypothetical protein
MIAQNPDWNKQVAEWIADDAVAEEYQRFFRLAGLDSRA